MKEPLFGPKEKSLLNGLSSALALRQVGLLLVLPFLSTWGAALEFSTPALLGTAMGIYGLTQGLLQVPYGLWSDRIGRKRPLVIGLIIFTLGMFLGFFSKNIYILIIARALQGAGAIGAVIFSWIGDTIPPEKRNRAMSIPGMAVGISSTLSFIAGPLLYKIMSVEYIFLLCSATSLIAVLNIIFFVKSGPKPEPQPFDIKEYLKALREKRLLPIFVSSLIINYSLIAVFFILPKLLSNFMEPGDLWIALAPATIAGIVFMRVSSKIADMNKTRSMLFLSYLTIIISGLLFFINNAPAIIAGTILFLSGYMSLVTILPGTLTKLVKAEVRGSVVGTFNTIQNLGSFIGGIFTGILWGIRYELSIIAVIALAVIGGILILTMLRIEKSGDND